MKKNRFWLFFALSLAAAFLMLLFTFLNWGYFSDGKKTVLEFAIPLTRRDSALKALADLAWLSAPFALIVSLLLSLVGKEKKLSPALCVLATLPLSLFAVLKLFSFLAQENTGHFSSVISMVFLLFTAALLLYASFFEEVRPFAAQMFLIHSGLETLLLILSFLFEEKLSQFYFSEYYLISSSSFRYWYVLISVFLFYLFYNLALFFRLLSGTPPEKTPLAPAEIDFSKEEEEEALPLSPEDFGIER